MDKAAAIEIAPANREIFMVFLKMGALAFGGVYSMLAFFQRDLVDRLGWLDQDSFAEAVSIGQMTPGPPIVNTGVFIGYRLKGMAGAAAAVAGLVLPGFFIVIGLGFVYLEYRDVPVVGSVLRGVGAAVVGLLLSVVYKMANRVVKNPFDMLTAAAAFGLLVFLRANPIALVAGCGLAGWLVYGRAFAGSARR